jgi:polyisoprenoid-binding protein YceI
MIRKFSLLGLMTVASAAMAAPVTYNIDPSRTFPSFEADHMGGLSIWRGRFNTTSGKVVLDMAAKTGNVEVTVDANSIDFGLAALDKHMLGPDGMDTARFPTATYKGTLGKWKGDAPTEVDGQLTMHGVTKPLKLTIHSFLCKPNPMSRKEVCGADASATFNREDFGMPYGKNFGFKMDVKLLISIEAVRAD